MAAMPAITKRYELRAYDRASAPALAGSFAEAAGQLPSGCRVGEPLCYSTWGFPLRAPALDGSCHQPATRPALRCHATIQLCRSVMVTHPRLAHPCSLSPAVGAVEVGPTGHIFHHIQCQGLFLCLCRERLQLLARPSTGTADVAIGVVHRNIQDLVKEVLLLRAALLLLHTYRICPAFLLDYHIQLFGRSLGVLWRLLTSASPSDNIAPAVIPIVGRYREISEGKTVISHCHRWIYKCARPSEYRASRPIARLPRLTGLISGFCSSASAFTSCLLPTPPQDDAVAFS